MESKFLLESIKSKYIIDNIFTFIKDDNFKFKLLKHCKQLQNILKLTLNNYKLESFKFINYSKFSNFLSFEGNRKVYVDNINILKNNFKKDIENYKINENIISDEFSVIYFTNLYNINKSKEDINKNILDNQLAIDIYSPFFELLSKKDIFQKLFITRIPSNLIKSKNLLNDYVEIFKNLNKLNVDYSNLEFRFLNDDDFNFFQTLNIDFKKIKKLIFQKESKNILGFDFFDKLFSFNDVRNNLIYSEINLGIDYDGNTNIFEKINNLKFLEELRLESVHGITLKLQNLLYLNLFNCQISIDENCCSQIKELSLFASTIIKKNSKLKFPKLVKLKFSYSFIIFKDIIDFKSLNKLKYFIRGQIPDFLDLGNTMIEKAYINNLDMDKKKKKRCYKK